ncbi:DUF1073 domain-containing protein [Achromobacter sp. GG226]|nr:DUF1073 domain-containing protein [Verticiella sp. GG226]
MANLGTDRDKAAHTVYVHRHMDTQELLTAYRNSWLARAIVDYPAEDATRKWRSWRAESDQITAIEAVEKRLGLSRKVQQALIAARLYGGAALYLNTDEADQDLPLVPGAGVEIKSLIVLTPNSLAADDIVRDINSPYYGRPERYLVASGARQVFVHASRFVIFQGSPIPEDAAAVSSLGQGWADSVLQSTFDAIKQVDATMANMASLVFEAKVDVFQFDGFAQGMEDGEDSLWIRRAGVQASMKSINGALAMDAKDAYSQKSASFAGLPEVVSKFMDAVSGASRIPVTRLYGRAAVGLSGSGDGDERVYFDRIGHMQSTEIAPAMSLLDDCILWQALGNRPEEIFYEWKPLRQLTESERADIFVKTANAARSIAGANAGDIIPVDALSDALVNELTEQGVLPGLEQAIKDHGTLAEQSLPAGGGEIE